MKSVSNESLEVTNRNSYNEGVGDTGFSRSGITQQKNVIFSCGRHCSPQKYVPVQNSDARKWDWDDHFTPSKTYIMKVML